jgi:transglutaminase-like putative cysteine protease
VPDEDVELHPTIQRVVETFRDRYGGLIDEPEFVRERCAELSEEFAELCRNGGLPARAVSGARFGDDPRFPGVTLLLAGHYATQVPARWDEPRQEWSGELVVDWTAHQFGNPEGSVDLPVPWMTSLDCWRETWRHL